MLKLRENYEENKNLESTILNARPPVFWKDKEIVKKQINSWNVKQLKESIYNINNIEMEIKKNYSNSLNIISNFILQMSSLKTNNGF